MLEGGRKDLEAKGKKVLKVGKYEKFAKTMLNPAANDGLYKKVLGHDLEIVLLTNPADIKAGDDIKAEVLLNGKPVKAPLGLTYDGYSAEQDAYMAKAETGAIIFTILTPPAVFLIFFPSLPCPACGCCVPKLPKSSPTGAPTSATCALPMFSR